MNLKKPLTPKVIYTALLFTTEDLIKRKSKESAPGFLNALPTNIRTFGIDNSTAKEKMQCPSRIMIKDIDPKSQSQEFKTRFNAGNGSWISYTKHIPCYTKGVS
jgi:hypothetical protein